MSMLCLSTLTHQLGGVNFCRICSFLITPFFAPKQWPSPKRWTAYCKNSLKHLCWSVAGDVVCRPCSVWKQNISNGKKNMRWVSPGCVWINNHFWSRWIFATMKGNRLVPNELESHCWDGWMANCSKDMENYVKLRKRSGGSKLTKRTFQLFNKDIFGMTRNQINNTFLFQNRVKVKVVGEVSEKWN